MEYEGEDQVVPEITCQEVVEWASAYLDNHVGEERKRHIVLHLAICAGCEAYVKQIATVRDAVRLLHKAAEQPSDSSRLQQAFAERVRRSSSGN